MVNIRCRPLEADNETDDEERGEKSWTGSKETFWRWRCILLGLNLFCIFLRLLMLTSSGLWWRRSFGEVEWFRKRLNIIGTLITSIASRGFLDTCRRFRCLDTRTHTHTHNPATIDPRNQPSQPNPTPHHASRTNRCQQPFEAGEERKDEKGGGRESLGTYTDSPVLELDAVVFKDARVDIRVGYERDLWHVCSTSL